MAAFLWPKGGTALKHCQSLTKKPKDILNGHLNIHVTVLCNSDCLERDREIFIVCKYYKRTRLEIMITIKIVIKHYSMLCGATYFDHCEFFLFVRTMPIINVRFAVIYFCLNGVFIL